MTPSSSIFFAAPLYAYPPLAIGQYAMGKISSESMYLTSSLYALYGCSSISFTAGGISQYVSRSQSSYTLKFDTPIDLASPSLTTASISFHVYASGILSLTYFPASSNLNATGQ